MKKDLLNNNNNIMEHIADQLQYIQKAIMEDTHQQQKGIIMLILSESISEVKGTTFTVDIPYVDERRTGHLKTFANAGKHAKAKLIASLEDLSGEINRHKINKNRCLKIIQRLLKSNLYKNDVQRLIDDWQTLGRNEVIKKPITV